MINICHCRAFDEMHAEETLLPTKTSANPSSVPSTKNPRMLDPFQSNQTKPSVSTAATLCRMWTGTSLTTMTSTQPSLERETTDACVSAVTDITVKSMPSRLSRRPRLPDAITSNERFNYFAPSIILEL